MSLAAWAANGWLTPYETSPREVAEQLAAAQRDLADAAKDLSASWRSAIAFQAGLRLCTIALSTCGYRAARQQRHYRTIAALPLALGDEARDLATFLDRCRAKRHEVAYDALDQISAAEADELIAAVHDQDELVRTWLTHERPELISKTS